MIFEAIIAILIIWNIILSYYLFDFYFVKYKSLEDLLAKHLAGMSMDEIIAKGREEIRPICEKRGWEL